MASWGDAGIPTNQRPVDASASLPEDRILLPIVMEEGAPEARAEGSQEKKMHASHVFRVWRGGETTGQRIVSILLTDLTELQLWRIGHSSGCSQYESVSRHTHTSPLANTTVPVRRLT